MLAPQLAQGSHFVAPDRMHARRPVLDAMDMQAPFGELDLVPLQVAHLQGVLSLGSDIGWLSTLCSTSFKALKKYVVIQMRSGEIITAAHEAAVRLKYLQIAAGQVYDHETRRA